jgi:hypothetical protein
MLGLKFSVPGAAVGGLFDDQRGAGFQRKGGLAQPVFETISRLGSACLPPKGLSLFRVLWVDGGALRRHWLCHQTPGDRAAISSFWSFDRSSAVMAGFSRFGGRSSAGR